MKGLWLLSALLIILSSCQHKPKETEVYRSSDINYAELSRSLNQPIQVTKDTLLLDARSPFEFGLSHVENSQSIAWADYKKTPLDKAARRLALLGVSLERPVVVLGNGRKGQGEEGRVAWMLMHLGVQSVQTADINSLKLRRAKAEEPKPENSQLWSPNIITKLSANSSEVLSQSVGKKEKGKHLIDVRSANEFLKDQDVRSININWEEFYTKSGRPNKGIKKRLESIGVSVNDRIVLISNHGLRSGAAAYALTMIGFKNVGSFTSGWTSLK